MELLLNARIAILLISLSTGSPLKTNNATSAVNPECLRRTFILDYTYFGRTREVKQQIVEMSLNSSGIRDIARVLEVGVPTVIRELKTKKPYLKSVNEKALERLRPEQVEVEVYKVKEAEEVEEAGVEESELDAPVERAWRARKIHAGCGTPLSAQMDKY